MIHLIDPGCIGETGHHLAINLALQGEFQRLGVEFRCWYPSAAQPGVYGALGGDGAVLESWFPYGRHPQADIAEERVLFRDLMRRDLERISFKSGDRILMHTAAPGQIEALDDVDIPARVILRFPPDHRATPAQARQMAQVWNEVLAETDVSLLADTAPLSRYFRRVVDSIPVCPIPVDWRYYKEQKAVGTDLLFLGELREEKGAHYLAEIMRHVRVKHPEARLVVPGACATPEYYAHIRRAAVVLAPYKPAEYAMRSSQTFIEALGFGKPVVTVKGSWMAEEIQNFAPRAGEIAEEFSPRQIALAANRLLDRLPEATRIANMWSSHVRARHSIRSLVDQILHD